jgi:hypothetical protein
VIQVIESVSSIQVMDGKIVFAFGLNKYDLGSREEKLMHKLINNIK